MVTFWALCFEKVKSYGKTRCHIKNSDTLDVYRNNRKLYCHKLSVSVK